MMGSGMMVQSSSSDSTQLPLCFMQGADLLVHRLADGRHGNGTKLTRLGHSPMPGFVAMTCQLRSSSF